MSISPCLTHSQIDVPILLQVWKVFQVELMKEINSLFSPESQYAPYPLVLYLFFYEYLFLSR